MAVWNRSARQGAWNEMKRGWMAKHEQRQDARGRLLRKRRPGIGALYEIRFYALGGKEYRWQARALFALQQAA